MRKTQENKFTMYVTVDTFLNENQSIVSGIPELNESYNKFKMMNAAIKGKDDEKKNVMKGKAVSKLRARNNVISASRKISAGLFAYAFNIKDDELAALSNVKKSDLDVMRDTELVEALEGLREIARTRLDVLEPYGVTQAKFDAFSDKIAVFDGTVGRTGTGMVRKKGATKSLKIFFKEGDELLDVIDKYINGLNDEHPEFVRNYNDSRLMKNLGVRHRKEELPEGAPAPEGQTPVS